MKIYLKKLFISFFFVLFLLQNIIAGITYYVKTNGSNSNSGLTWTNAWKTLQYAADIMTNGDTLVIAAGIYDTPGRTVDSYSTIVCITNSGTSANPITYTSYTNGVILNASGKNSGIHIYHADYIVINGIEVMNANNNGVCLNTGAQHITIKRCNVHNCSANGISVGRTVGGGGDGDSRGNCDNTTIKNSIVYNNGAGIYIYCSAGCTVESNIVHHNSSHGGIEIYARGSSTVINYLNYNISYSNRYGIELSYKNERADHQDTVIEHSILYANSLDGLFAGCSFVNIRNSIIYKNYRYGLNESDYGWGAGTTDIQTAYNDVCSNAFGNYHSTVGISAGTGDISYDPLFKTFETGVWSNSFLLKSKYDKSHNLTGDTNTSPCIDRGDTNVSVILPDIRIDIGLHYDNIGYPNNPTNLGPSECVNGSLRTITIATLNFIINDAVVPSSIENLRYIIQVACDSNFISLVANYTSSYGSMGWRTYITPVLANGDYYWRVMAEDDVRNKGYWTYANNGAVAFRIVNDEPVLSWLGIGDYISTGVSPESGTTGDTYDFRVSYMEPNNNPPVVKELWIDLNDDGDYDDTGEKVSMDEFDTDDITYTDGKYYEKNIVLRYTGDGFLNYRFYFNNGNKAAVGLPTKDNIVEVKGLSKTVSVLDNVIHLNNETKCKIKFVLNADTSVQIKIYDITGSLIKEIELTNIILNDMNTAYWDGTDEHGYKVGEGIYFLYFKAGVLELKRKIIVIR